jgi:hypothetical protein
MVSNGIKAKVLFTKNVKVLRKEESKSLMRLPPRDSEINK